MAVNQVIQGSESGMRVAVADSCRRVISPAETRQASMTLPLHNPTLGESDTRAKLIDPALYLRGWTEDFIRREETAGAIEIINDKPRRRAKGFVDYTLRLVVAGGRQPVAVALIEAKAEHLLPGHGLDQAKGYARCKRMNVPFVFSSNGHQFVEYDRFTGLTSEPRLMSEFPTPAEVQRRYELGMGFLLTDEAAKPLLAPYVGGESGRRYYQDAAIRAVFEKIVKMQDNSDERSSFVTVTNCGRRVWPRCRTSSGTKRLPSARATRRRMPA